MAAKYIYRMDDITPTMNWKRFWQYIDLFKKYNVKPLLGVVPDNKDPKLMVDSSNPDFWEILRKLQSEGTVEICQHGYQHKYVTAEGGVLGPKFGFKAQSEFAGLSYDEQYNKIKAGKDILEAQGIYTDTWMAPSHSFDDNTLKALSNLGFKAITDGIALYPYKHNDLIFVPQQFWEPVKVLTGIVTICLHTDTVRESLYEKIEAHLKSGAQCIAFSDAVKYKETAAVFLINKLFCFRYLFRLRFNENGVVRKLKSVIKRIIGRQ